MCHGKTKTGDFSPANLFIHINKVGRLYFDDGVRYGIYTYISFISMGLLSRPGTTVARNIALAAVA